MVWIWICAGTTFDTGSKTQLKAATIFPILDSAKCNRSVTVMLKSRNSRASHAADFSSEYQHAVAADDFRALWESCSDCLCLSYLLMQSPYQTQVRVVQPQPVPFSHEHHVRGLGIDCRYCHTSVETSAFAGLPPTHTCMSCHSQIWASSPMLEPVRTSLAENKPLAWTRVHDLPDFVYFNHAIHVQKGSGMRVVPWPGRQDAPGVEGRADDHGMVPGVSSPP